MTGERYYLDLLREALLSGNLRATRNGEVYSLFGRMLRFDLSLGFPLLTTKRVHFPSIAAELCWFLRGETNVDYLHLHGCTIWDEWADDHGDLGPVYGKQWRDFGGVDQISALIGNLRERPFSRRHLVSAWNPPELDRMALPPCHFAFQFHVSDQRLSCLVSQRSADIFLGLPFNIASYALLTHIVARHTGFEPGELVLSLGDAHLYTNHVNQAGEQLKREPRPFPELGFNTYRAEFGAWEPGDFRLIGYAPHEAIRAEVRA